jgi:EmrB/QacA subfamily drug resistance transporter
MTHRPLASEGKAAHQRPLSGSPCAPEARPFVLAATIVASAMAFIDGTVVSIALPAIQTALATDIVAMQWVVNAYLLILGALILAGGGLGDRVGRRRVFLVGIVIFAVASLLCAVAPNVQLLIAARALQGIGAALLVPQSLAIISANFPKEVRGRAIGTWAAASAVTTSLGPPLGGFLIDVLSWRAAFWINLPLSALALFLTWRFVPESRDESTTGAIDWTGALTAVAAFGALTYGFSALSEGGANPVIVGVTVLAGLAGIAIFAIVESRVANPIMPPILFRSRVFTVINILTVFLYGALSGALFLLPFDLLARRGLTAAEAGLVILPLGLLIGAFSRLAGSLADTYGARIFLIVGPALVGIGSALLGLGIESLWVGVVLPVVLIGAGMAIAVSPLTTAVMNAAPEGKSGAASGVSNAASRLAGVIAVAIFGATAGLIFASLAPEGARFGIIPEPDAASRAAVEAAFLAGYNVSMLLAAVWALLAAGLAYFLLPDDRPALERGKA